MLKSFLISCSISIMLRGLVRLGKRLTGLEMVANNISTSGIKTSGKLSGKVAVVTASTDGIGLAIAERLGAEGASVMISSRKEKNVIEAVTKLQGQGYNVAGTVCHVAKSSDREKMFKEAESKFGGIDILVSNAAVNPTVGPVLDCPEESWDKIFEVNVKSAFLLSKEVLPYIRKRGGGSIVYISSIAGYQPLSLLGAYSVSKTALLGLTKAAAVDLATENIRVNCVAPGVVNTRFSSVVRTVFEHGLLYFSPLTDSTEIELALQNLRESDVAKEASLSLIPMRRFAEPNEISGVVSFLVSDDASYITGETIVAAGCMASRL